MYESTKEFSFKNFSLFKEDFFIKTKTRQVLEFDLHLLIMKSTPLCYGYLSNDFTNWLLILCKKLVMTEN